ncbi:3-beta hydroxysteroid dehydrogenase isomerase family protein [Moniliophthora roreri MCA 2997]|uniref:3-beta hydroxysteroid dehydrogenase isomerase family protein n=2 Tax=Moniliophthora roreri TaxID=221103 RepID=V2X559_MONRO|nr:3-beta hydroxysteroid dehydrogenase isomerase family protein [Moniliophthora roreri MCA 2997]KAI3607494.1 3-beta hydroxysteroid dehydrogenase isomerase family protein [Moniliophthora roreri]
MMSSTTGLVLVTGATGFIGSHIVSQLLAKDIRVRAVVRSLSKVRAIFPNAGSQLEVVEIPTLLDDHTEALKGVSAVIHTAVPGFHNGASNEDTLKGAYEGTLNIVNQAISLGIKKIIVTGSYVNLFDTDFNEAYGDRVITEKEFGSIELADIKPQEQDAFFIYQAAKTVADKRLLQIARENPDIDLTVLLPSMVLGPLVPNFPYPSDISQLGTNSFVYGLIAGGPDGPNTYPSLSVGHVVDVRDVAKAHVLALDAPPVAGRHKRMIISSAIFKWKDAAEVIRTAHPELASRLPSSDAVPPVQKDAVLDTSFTSEVLGLKEYIPWDEMVLAAIEVCLEHERRFKH